MERDGGQIQKRDAKIREDESNEEDEFEISCFN
jgi:hypothetical protein